MTQAVQNVLIDVDSSDLKAACARLADAGKKSKEATKAIGDFGKKGKKAGDGIRQSIGKIEGPIDAVKAKLIALGKNPVLAIIALATAATTLTSSLINAGDQIDKNALFSNVSTDRIQTLTFALGQMGIESETVKTGLKDLNKNVGEFVALGAGPAKESLDKLGLSSKILTGELSGNEDIFDAVIQQLEKVQSPAERAALANKLFGEEAGSKLAGALSGGSKAIFDLENQLTDLGGVVSKEGINKAVQYKDKLSELATVAKGKASNAFWSLVPSLETVSTKFDIVKGSLGRLLRIMTLVPRFVKQNLTKVFESAFKFITDGFVKLNKVIAGVLEKLNIDVSIFSGENIDFGIAKIEDALGLTKELNDALNTPATGGLIEDGVNEWVEESSKVKGLTNDLEVLRGRYKELYDTKNKGTGSSGGTSNTDTEDAKELVRQADVNKALSVYGQFQESMNKLEKDGIKAREKLKEEADERKKARAKAINKGIVDTANAELERRQSIEDAVASKADEYLDGFITSALEGKDAFKEFADSVIKDLARIALKKAVLGAFDQAGGNNPDTGFGGLVSSFVSSFAKSNRGNVISGNQVHSSAPTTMAENGAEGILPLRRDSNGNLGVIAASGGGSSEGAVSNNINVTVNVGAGSNAEEISRQTAQQVKNAMASIANEQIRNTGKAGRSPIGVR